jgi:hypothetical protein
MNNYELTPIACRCHSHSKAGGLMEKVARKNIPAREKGLAARLARTGCHKKPRNILDKY